MERFQKVATVDERNPLDLWGGAAGELPSIWMSTGTRVGGGNSRVFRHDKGTPDTLWVDDDAPLGSDGAPETYGKIVDDGSRVYVYCERDGDTPIVSRDLVEPGWEFSGPETTDFLGGRALAAGDGHIWVGGMHQGNHPGAADYQTGELFEDSGSRRVLAPGITWECVFASGELWEFWHHVGETEAVVYRNGDALGAPTDNVACAAEFQGSMYAGGDHLTRSQTVWRWTGSEWESVLTMAGMVEHLVAVPRTPPVFFAVCQAPLEVWESLDGSAWVKHDEIGEINTGSDTNNVAGLGYHDGRVWLAARDEALNQIQIWADKSGAADLILQVI
jgi:hypothetical protein